MKTKLVISLLVFATILSCKTNSENNGDLVLSKDIKNNIRLYDVQAAKQNQSKLGSKVLRDCFDYHIARKEMADFSDSLLFQHVNAPKTNFEELFLDLTIGEWLWRNNEDSLSYIFLKKAENNAFEIEDDYWEFETNLGLVNYFKSNKKSPQNNELYKNYYQKVIDYKSNLDAITFDILSLMVYNGFVDFGDKKIEAEEYPVNLFSEMQALNFSEPIMKANIFYDKSIYYSYVMENSPKAIEMSDSAIVYFKQSKVPYAKQQIFYNQYNQAIDRVDQGELDIAESEIKRLILNLNLFKKKNFYMKHHLHKNLADVFEQKQIGDSAIQHLKISNLYKDSMEENSLTKSTLATQLRFGVEQKEKELEVVTKSKTFFQRNFFFLLPLALLLGFFTFLLFQYAMLKLCILMQDFNFYKSS